eukprot:s4408_g1.t1
MLGHLLHPQVRQGFLLEHGCEKTHNDWFAARLAARGAPLERFGWASVQMDGGIEAVYARISEFFKDHAESPPPVLLPASALRVAVIAAAVPKAEALFLSELIRFIVLRGGTVLLPSTSPLLSSDAFLAATLFEELPGKLLSPTLAYAQIPSSPGLHVMEVPSTASSVEIVAGLAPAVHCFVTWLDDRGLQPAHPFVPTVHVTEELLSATGLAPVLLLLLGLPFARTVHYPYDSRLLNVVTTKKKMIVEDGGHATEADVIVDLVDTHRALVAVFGTLREALRGAKTKESRHGAGIAGAVDFSVTRGITSGLEARGYRRLNVAVSRAVAGLVIVGDLQHLARYSAEWKEIVRMGQDGR